MLHGSRLMVGLAKFPLPLMGRFKGWDPSITQKLKRDGDTLGMSRVTLIESYHTTSRKRPTDILVWGANIKKRPIVPTSH